MANKHLPRIRMHAVPLLSRHCRFHFAVTTQTMFPVDLGSHTFHETPTGVCDCALTHIFMRLTARWLRSIYRLDKSMYKITQRDGGLSIGQQSQAHDLESFEALQEIRYDTICYFNVRSKANISQLNLPHGTTTKKCKKKRKIIPNKSFVNAMANA